MNDLNIQMLFNPQNCTYDLLQSHLTTERRNLAQTILQGIDDKIRSGIAGRWMIHGPRGVGKTHVLAYIYKKARMDHGGGLETIVLAEEERGVLNLLDFLNSCLRKGGMAPAQILSRVNGHDYDTMLAQARACFAELGGGKPVLLVIENFSDLLRGMEESGPGDLLEFLSVQPRVSILASSVRPLDSNDNEESPFSDFFHVYPIQKISPQEARRFLSTLARSAGDDELADTLSMESSQARVNAIYDLTGGNHRLLAMLARFLTVASFSDLVRPFVEMVDRELTPYYQQRLDRLSPRQNKILTVLAQADANVLNVDEIAKMAFMKPGVVSRQIVDLRHDGYVARRQRGKHSYYELAEPLLRLVLDFKEERNKPLSTVVRFLRNWYESDELKQIESQVPDYSKVYYRSARETVAQVSPIVEPEGYIPDERHQRLLDALTLKDYGCHEEALERFYQLEREFLGSNDPEEQLICAKAMVYRQLPLCVLGRLEERAEMLDRVISLFGDIDDPGVQEQVAYALELTAGTMKCSPESLAVSERIIVRHFGTKEPRLRKLVVGASINKAGCLCQMARFEEAEVIYKQLLDDFGCDELKGLLWFVANGVMGLVSQPHHPTESQKSLGETVLACVQDLQAVGTETSPNLTHIKTRLLHWLGRLEEALEVCNDNLDSIEKRYGEKCTPVMFDPLMMKGMMLRDMGRDIEAIDIFDRIHVGYRDSDDVYERQWSQAVLLCKAQALRKMSLSEESLDLYDNVLKSPVNDEVRVWTLRSKSETLFEMKRHDEALECFKQDMSLSAHKIYLVEYFERIVKFIDDERVLREVTQLLSSDAEVFTKDLLRWIKKLLPMDSEAAEDLTEFEVTLKTYFSGVKGAEMPLKMLNCVRRDVMGDPKALLELPLEIRHLVEREKN